MMNRWFPQNDTERRKVAKKMGHLDKSIYETFEGKVSLKNEAKKEDPE